MLLSFLLNIHSHYSATISRPSSWLYQARLMWALCFGLWFRSKCCQHVNNHLYSIYTWNDLMLLSFLLNIHSHYSATTSRPSSRLYQARLTWALCFGLWFRSKCCQHANNHLYSIYTWNDLMLLSFLLNIHSHYSAAASRVFPDPYHGMETPCYGHRDDFSWIRGHGNSQSRGSCCLESGSRLQLLALHFDFTK